MDKITLGIDS